MSDQTQEPGRVDFRSISSDPQFADVDRVMAKVSTRHKTARVASQPTVLSIIAAHSRTLCAAAAVLIAIATLSLSLPRGGQRTAAPEVALADWAQANHVPTNAELLITFRGYGQ